MNSKFLHFPSFFCQNNKNKKQTPQHNETHLSLTKSQNFINEFCWSTSLVATFFWHFSLVALLILFPFPSSLRVTAWKSLQSHCANSWTGTCTWCSMKIDQTSSPLHDENAVDSRARCMCFVRCLFECVRCGKSEFSQFSIFIKFVNTVPRSSTEKVFNRKLCWLISDFVSPRTKFEAKIENFVKTVWKWKRKQKKRENFKLKVENCCWKEKKTRNFSPRFVVCVNSRRNFFWCENSSTLHRNFTSE